jgi:hypothetical protein
MGAKMIIETSDNRFYRVWETEQDGLDHVWFGERVRQFKCNPGVWQRANSKAPELVRKAATRIVEAA